MTLLSLSLEKDLCRCCLIEGSFVDLAQPYVYNGREEVYSDMIKDIYNIEIRPVPGQLCVVTYKICSLCIDKLREAFLFRELILKSEARFKELYEKSKNGSKGLSISTIKEEKNENTDNKGDYSVLNSQNNYEMKLEEELDKLTGSGEDSLNFNGDDRRDDDFDMKLEDSEEETISKIKENKKSKAKAKVKSPKAKQKKKATKKNIKEEAHKEETAEGSAPKKKKGDTAPKNYTQTTDEHGTANFVCNTCQTAFKRKDSVVQHINHVHLKQRPKLRSCYLCEDRVPGHVRAFHLETKHGIPAPTCNACGKKFAYPYQVERHQRTFHMGERLYACDVCHLTFAARTNLTQHSIKHSALRRFRCDVCRDTFKLKKHLVQHERVHLKAGRSQTATGLKEPQGKPKDDEENYTLTQEADGTECYACNSCQKTFKNRPCFKQHYNHVHLNLRPKLIGCYYCEVKVAPHLRAFHLEEMHGIPAPTCNACGKKFARNCEVLRHQQIYHMGEKSYVCDVCNMTFARRNSLRQHVVKHSAVRNFKCDYCEKAFKWRKHLRRHVMLHMKRQV